MRDWDAELQEIFANPIFDDVHPARHRSTADERLKKSFMDVLEFIEGNSRLPSEDGDMEEATLARALKSIREDERKRRFCLQFDDCGILEMSDEEFAAHAEHPCTPKTPEEELEDIFNNPLFADVSAESGSIFDLPDYMKDHIKERAEADSIAKRTECKNFADYREGFEIVHAKLRDGRARLIRFKEAHLAEGQYFVLGNVLLFLDHINKDAARRDSRGRADDRTRCIFENGTENDVYQQTLAKSLYTDGYTVQDFSEIESDTLLKAFNVTDRDVATGYIYVLSSLSEDPEIKNIKDLYKIGFTRQTVEQRIANAANESTYLFAPVKIVASWKVFNVKASTFEDIIHRLFGNVQLQVDAGLARPREWYVVPFEIIDQAVHHIIEGHPIAYDHTLRQLILLAEPQKSTPASVPKSNGFLRRIFKKKK